MTLSSRASAASTCSCWASATTATSASTSRATPSSWAPTASTLKPETIEANKRFFDGNEDLVPKQAYTMGIKTIMQARKVLMVVNGKGKAEIVKEAFFGPVTPEVPASILQMHPDFILVGDEEAFSLI